MTKPRKPYTPPDLSEAVRRVVDQCPPLTERQIARLSAIFSAPSAAPPRETTTNEDQSA